MNQPEQIPNTTPPPPAAGPSAAPRVPAADPRIKSPVIAGALSAMPGLGQVYVGYYQRGFVHIFVVAGIIALLAADVLGPLIPLAGLFLGFFWLYNMIDAGRRAALYNQALSGGRSRAGSRSSRSASSCCSTRASECRSSGSKTGGRRP